MNFVVLVKQTPDISLVKIDDNAGEVQLADAGGTINPSDEYAVEEGIRLKERFGGKTTILTVGSEKAESTIRACLALGADEGILLCDEQFNGSDSQATAKILAAGLNKIADYTLVIGGKQSADEESGQTPAAVAALLDVPGVGFVKKIEDIKDNIVIVQRTTEDGYDKLEVSLPVILACEKEIADPRLPSLKGKMAAKKKTITRWSASDLGLDSSAIGANSATKRLKVSSPPPRKPGEFVEGETPAEIADKLYKKLKADQVL